MKAYGVIDCSIRVPRTFDRLPADLANRIKVFEKPVAMDDQEIITLAEKCIWDLLDQNSIEPGAIQYLLVGGLNTFDRGAWSAASALQGNCGLRNARVIDFQNGCLSMITGVKIAQGLLSDPAGLGILVCLDRLSKLVDVENPDHWSISSFADAAGAYLLGNQNVRYELRQLDWITEGDFSDNLYWDHALGRLVLKEDTEEDRRLGQAYRQHYSRWLRGLSIESGLALGELGGIFMNQGDHHLIRHLETALELRSGTITRTHERYGHLGANDCFFGLQEEESLRPLPKGAHFVTAASALGFSWGAALWRKS